MTVRLPDSIEADSLSRLRREKDEFFRSSPDSPLFELQRQLFTGLSYYPYNATLDLVVELKPVSVPNDVELATNTGERRWFLRIGAIEFEVADFSERLTVYRTASGYLLPFIDAGAGTKTYPAGRYLEPEPIEGQTFHVDFNRAYNPYCAYNHHWSCPLTPEENRLGVSIAAGEKLPPIAWSGDTYDS